MSGGDEGRASVTPQERTDGPLAKPTGELDGQPINADETAPREQVPDPAAHGSTGERHPEAVDDEPGSDL
jgi:hypothetical protein